MADIIQNLLTKQGTKADVAQNFAIADLICDPISAKQMRAVTASEAMPRKVVDFIPRIMADVNFSVGVAGTSSTDNNDDAVWISDQLKRLIPWMADGQIIANTVGKAYLVIDRDQDFFEDESIIEESKAQPKNEVGNNLEDNDVTEHDAEDLLSDRDSTLVQLMESISRKIAYENANGYTLTSDERLTDELPLCFSIDWAQENIDSVHGVQILPGDFYNWTTDGEYLIRTVGGQISDSGGLSSFDGQGKNISSEHVERWLQKKRDQLDKNKNHSLSNAQYQAVHKSHVIELFAFDYQDDSIIKSGRATLATQQNNGNLVSHRLSRFIPAFLRYSSFINATLNRIHRSEFIAYGKENLGDLAVDIARTLGEMQGKGTGSITDTGTQADVMAVMKAEMERILDSAMNQGLVMYDSKHKLEIISRTFTGMKDFNNIFRDALISASGLTEFVLFGINSAGTGLSSMDIRDRKFIADQSDGLWADHWLPPMLHLANLLSLTKDQIDIKQDVIKISLEKSFKLTDSEMSEWVERVINSRAKLLENRVLSPAMVLKELASDSMLGQHFVLVKDDVMAHIEKLETLAIEEMGSANRSGGLYPVKSTEIKAESNLKAAEIKAEAIIGAEVEASTDITTSTLATPEELPSSTSTTEDPTAGKQGDAALTPTWKRNANKRLKLWKGYLNMSDTELSNWIETHTKTGIKRTGTKPKNSIGRIYSKEIARIRVKKISEITEPDLAIINREIAIIERVMTDHLSSGKTASERRGKKVLTRQQVSLRNHGVFV
jgi:hypothetical protein